MQEQTESKESAPEVSTFLEAKAEITSLITEARSLAETELAYWKARARYSAGQAGQSAIYGGLSVALLLCTLIALILGLLLIAAHWLGPVWATVLVTGTCLLASAVFGLLARKHALLLRFLSDPGFKSGEGK